MNSNNMLYGMLYGPLTKEQAASAAFWSADWEKKFGPNSTVGDIGEHTVRCVAVEPPLSAEQLSAIREQFCGLDRYEDPPPLTEDRLREQDARLQEWLSETDRANRWYGEHHD